MHVHTKWRLATQINPDRKHPALTQISNNAKSLILVLSLADQNEGLLAGNLSIYVRTMYMYNMHIDYLVTGPWTFAFPSSLTPRDKCTCTNGSPS